MDLYRKLIPGNIFVDEATSGKFEYLVAETNPDAGAYELVTPAIEGWDLYGHYITPIKTVYDELKALYDAGTWAGFTASEKGVFARRMVASKSERDEIHSTTEQKEYAKKLIELVTEDRNSYDLDDAAILLSSQSDSCSLMDNLTNGKGDRLYLFRLINENYNLKGYQKERTFNSKGDIDKVIYYEDYIDVNNKGKKKVEETRTYTRDGSTGILVERDIDHKWYEDDIEIANKATKKKYSSEEGYEANKRAAKNLTRTASMYLASQIGIANGQAYLDTVVTDISAYESGSRASLLADIVGTDFTTYGATDATHDATIKATLDAILNVSYT